MHTREYSVRLEVDLIFFNTILAHLKQRLMDEQEVSL